MQFGGIALGILLLFAIIGFVVYKKTHKDRVEVIVVKENDADDDEPIPAPKPSGENFHHLLISLNVEYS